MFKLKLNDLCRKRQWAAPAYTNQHEGPDHAPSFNATVVVGGAEFCSPEEGGTAKVAENLAARVAFEHLSAIPAPPSPGPETQVPHKSQLQEYAQKRNKQLPSYHQIQEGPPHATLFKSIVTIDGQTFESPQYCRTIKAAQSAAANLALKVLTQAGSSSLNQTNYKLELQIYAQKRHKQLPSYHQIQEGPPHATLFKSRVTIDGQTFQSPQYCRTIKAAQSAAANLALISLSQEASTQEQLLVQAIQYTSSDNPDHLSIFKSTVHTQGEYVQVTPSKKQKQMQVSELGFQHSKNSVSENVVNEPQAPNPATNQAEQDVQLGKRKGGGGRKNKRAPEEPTRKSMRILNKEHRPDN